MECIGFLGQLDKSGPVFSSLPVSELGEEKKEGKDRKDGEEEEEAKSEPYNKTGLAGDVSGQKRKGE